MDFEGNEYIEVRNSNIHNKGVFAKKNIRKGTRIVEYIGEKITKKESDRRADLHLDRSKEREDHGAVYIFELNSRFDLDGHVPENFARFINHSCLPNCETEIIRGRIWIIATRSIKAGEEICYNYGYPYDEDYHEHECQCRSENCVGYILAEEHWSTVKRKRKKSVKSKTSRKGIIFRK